ncbi:MAG: hypothetical protein J0I41_21455 [Filimonas sp.]|nr:hypothetical protein [Filimonas sp.]
MERVEGQQITIDGVGEFFLTKGPDSILLWQTELSQPVVYAEDPVVVNILLEGNDKLEDVNFPLVQQVVSSLDDFLLKGVSFLREKLQSEPDFFELDETEAQSFLEEPIETFPLYGPGLTFYTGGNWFIQFAEGDLPICDPYGIIIAFKGEEPVEVENLADSDEFED